MSFLNSQEAVETTEGRGCAQIRIKGEEQRTRSVSEGFSPNKSVFVFICNATLKSFRGLRKFFGVRRCAVAQVSKPAVSPISKTAGVGEVMRFAGLETRDTADLEVLHYFGCGFHRCVHPWFRFSSNPILAFSLKGFAFKMSIMRVRPAVVLALVMLGNSVLGGEDQQQASQGGASAVSFVRDIASILNKKCVACHGPEKSKGHYRLDTFELLMKKGDSEGMPVTPGDAARSHLYQLITATDPDDRMPQKDDPLSEGQINLIKRWIEQGAAFDGGNAKAALATLIPRQPYPNPPEVYRFPIPIRALAFSPDGQELAVGGYHEVTFWNPTNGALSSRIKDLPERIQGLSYSPDGSLLAIVGGAPGQSGEVTLVEPRTGSVAKILGTMPDVMLTIAFSPDGKRVAAGGADNSIHIYEVLNGRERLLIQQHADWVMALAWNPDGSQLASASRDRTARVYDTQTGELESTYTEHAAPVYATAFSGDGKQVFSAGRDKKIHIWNVADGKKTGEISGFEDEIYALIFTNGKLISASADKLVREHSAVEKKLVRTFTGHADRVYSVALDGSNQRLATSSHDGEVRIWSGQTGEQVLAFKAFPGARRRGATD